MEMYDYSQPVKLYDVTFKNRLLNSAGCWCTTEKELIDLVNSDCGGIVSKSCLLNPYDGNPKPDITEILIYLLIQLDWQT